MNNEIRERNSFLTAHISDIHFGAFDSEVLYNELKVVFINETLKKLPLLDVIFFQGDVFHYELSLNGKHAWSAFKFFEDVKKVIKKKKLRTKIRIIKGTKSHDHDQLESLVYDSDIDIKLINTVDVEYINGVKILYLPEEYIADPETYYKSYFNDTYDYIVGHGMFDETAFHNYNSEINMEAAPVYDSKLLSSIANFICFGHIHDAVTFKNVYYTGSFSRWCQGEENPKGFIMSAYNKLTGQVAVMPIINHLARRFNTININKIIRDNDIDDIIRYVDKYYDKHDIYKLRLIINEQNDATYMGKVALIQNNYSYNRLIDVVIERKNNIIEEDEDNGDIEKYHYLFDDSIDENKKISLFLKDNGYDLSPDKVNELVNCDILKLIDAMTNTDDD